MKVEGKVVEENGDPQSGSCQRQAHWLQDENGFTYPLAVMEGIKGIKN